MFYRQIKNDASIESKAWDVATALTYEFSYKQKEMAEFLIESDANVNLTCTYLETPLHFALMLNHEEFVLLLLRNLKWSFFMPRIKPRELQTKKV